MAHARSTKTLVPVGVWGQPINPYPNVDLIQSAAAPANTKMAITSAAPPIAPGSASSRLILFFIRTSRWEIALTFVKEGPWPVIYSRWMAGPSP
jgi:hypothetical protein